MNEMIERVAKAIKDSDSYQDYKDYKGYARAAIEAMREPTEEMIEAGGGVISEWNGDMTPATEAAAQIAWPAMIDEALK